MLICVHTTEKTAAGNKFLQLSSVALYSLLLSQLLFQSNLCALCLELCLQLLSLSLGCALLNYLRSAVNYFLSFLQAKTSCLTNNLDNLNLVRANLCQLYVELSLLFSFLSCASTCCCYYNACCCRYAKLFLTCLYQLVELKYG